MRRRWSVVVWLAIGIFTFGRVPAAAQDLALAKPRFIATWAAPGEPNDASGLNLFQRRVSLDLSDVPLGAALRQVATQARLDLSYDKSVLPSGRRVSVHAQGLTVLAALTEILLQSGLDVAVGRGGQLALARKPKPAAIDSGAIVGRVTDKATGAPIVGATIAVDGTSLRTNSDEDGSYRLADVPAASYTLQVRYIGYAPAAVRVTVTADQDVTADFGLERSAQRLDEVVTTGTVVPTEVKALPTPVDVVTAADIEHQQIRRIDQIFRLFVPAAVAWDLGTSPEHTAITVRGASSFTGGTGVKIFVDGVEVSSTTFTLIDPSSVERVEVIRGPQASTIYGPAAIGGVMQVFTKKGDASLQRPELQAQASAGLLESDFKDGGTLRQEYQASVQGGAGSFGYNLGGSYGRTGEWIPEFRLRQPSLYGSGQFVQGPLRVELNARYYATHQNIPNQPRLVRAGLVSPLPRHEERHYRQSTYGARLTYTPTGWWRHGLTVGSDDFSGTQYNTRPQLRTPDDTFLTVISRESRKNSVAYHTSVTARPTQALGAVVTAGFDHFEVEDESFVAPLARNFEGNITPDPSVPITALRNPTRNTGWFGQAQLDLDEALFLTGGVRVDDHSLIGSDDPVSPRVGIAYSRPVAGLTVKLRAAYGEAIRAPTSLDRLGFDVGFARALPNPGLGAERQEGVDAGVDLAWGAGSVSATYFRQTAEDLIQSTIVEVDTVDFVPVFQSQNAGRVRNTGVELQAALRVGSVQLTGNYAYTRSKVLELSSGYLGDLLPGDQVLEIPKHTAAATAALTPFRSTSVSVGFTYVGERTAYDYVPQISGTCTGRECFTIYDEFLKANVSISQALTPRISALLTVENLSNNDTGEQVDYLPSLGRITTLGVRARW